MDMVRLDFLKDYIRAFKNHRHKTWRQRGWKQKNKKSIIHKYKEKIGRQLYHKRQKLKWETLSKIKSHYIMRKSLMY